MTAYAVGAETDSALIFSPAAATKVAELIKEEENDALNLRVFITGGGCSGFQYGFTFDEEVQDDDMIFETAVENYHRAIKLLVDPMSYQYLASAEIDYREDLQGEQFVIKNPNAKTTCGCGSSFSVEDDELL